MNIVIGGGSGFIGKHLGKQLIQKGYSVINVGRTAGKGKLSWDEIKSDGLPPCKAVVNLAGQNLFDPVKRWSDQFVKDCFDSRLKTTTALAEAIVKMPEPPEAFICTSATGYYPFSWTEEFTEYYDGPPADFVEQLVPKWEARVTLPETHENVRRVIIRTGLVMGKDGGMLQQLRLPYYFGLGGVVASGKQYMPWIHVDDIAGIFVHAIESDVTGILNGTAPNPVTNYEFTKAFGAALWRPTIFWVPEFAVNIMLGKERAPGMILGNKVVPQRVLETGYKFKFEDIHEALKDLCS